MARGRTYGHCVPKFSFVHQSVASGLALASRQETPCSSMVSCTSWCLEGDTYTLRRLLAFPHNRGLNHSGCSTTSEGMTPEKRKLLVCFDTAVLPEHVQFSVARNALADAAATY